MLVYIEFALAVKILALLGRSRDINSSLKVLLSFTTAGSSPTSFWSLKSSHFDTHSRMVPHFATTGRSFQGFLWIFAVVLNFAILSPKDLYPLSMKVRVASPRSSLCLLMKLW